MLTGENGILTQAQNAKDKTEQAEKEEMSDLDSMESLINEYTGDVNIPQVTDEKPGELEQENETIFVINSIEDLVVFSYNVRSGTKYEGQTVKLGVNLDFKSDKSYVDPDRTDYGIYGYDGNLKQLLTTGEGFIPIGSQDGTNSFYGRFDGDNNVICSLYEYINNTSENESIRGGLFAENYGEIRNIDLMNVNLEFMAEKSLATGGVSGINYNNIINCNVSGNMRTTAKVYSAIGGICGETRGETNIKNCSSFINIYSNHVNNLGSLACGGIVAQTNIVDKKVNIDRCFNAGNINIDGGITQISVGGIIGGSFTGDSCDIKNCYNSGKIQGITSKPYESNVAGIAGLLRYGNLSNCYNIGDVIGSETEGETGDIFTIGGILGNQYSDTSVKNVFNAGKIICLTCNNDFKIGGLIGGTGYDTSNISLNDGYNTGKIEIEGINSNKIGSISGSRAILPSNCYYLKGTYSVGVGEEGVSTGVSELDDISKFPSVLSVVNEEGAFKEDVNNINDGYPILEWQ